MEKVQSAIAEVKILPLTSESCKFHGGCAGNEGCEKFLKEDCKVKLQLVGFIRLSRDRQG